MFSSLSTYGWSAADEHEAQGEAQLDFFDQIDDSQTTEDDWVWVEKRSTESDDLPQEQPENAEPITVENSEKSSLELLFNDNENLSQQHYSSKEENESNKLSQKTSLQILFDERSFENNESSAAESDHATESSSRSLDKQTSLQILFDENASELAPASKGSENTSQKTSLEMLFEEPAATSRSGLKAETSTNKFLPRKVQKKKLTSSGINSRSEESMETSEVLLSQQRCITRRQKRLMLQRQVGEEPSPCKEKKPRSYGTAAGRLSLKQTKRESKPHHKPRGGRKKNKGVNGMTPLI